MTPEQLGNLFLTAPIWEDPELEAEARDILNGMHHFARGEVTE